MMANALKQLTDAFEPKKARVTYGSSQAHVLRVGLTDFRRRTHLGGFRKAMEYVSLLR